MQKYELYYQVAHSHLQEQDQRAQSLEVRASGAMGLGVALLGLVALIINTAFEPGALVSPGLAIMVACLVAFLSVVGFGFTALRPGGGWRRDPDLKRFESYLPHYEDDTLVKWAGDQFREAVDANEGTLQAKAASVHKVFVSLGLLAIFVCLLAVWSKA